MVFGGKVTHIELRTNVTQQTDDGIIVEQYNPEVHDLTLVAGYCYSVYVEIDGEFKWAADCELPIYAKLLGSQIANWSLATLANNIVEIDYVPL